MLYIKHNVVAKAPQTLTVGKDYDALYLSRASARVFSELYGFDELPYFNKTPCTEYYQQALHQYLEGTQTSHVSAFQTPVDTTVHNHTGALCGVFGERVMLRADRAVTSRGLAKPDHLRFSSSSAKCATPMQLLRLFERSRSMHDMLLITGDIADNVDLRLNPVALSSDTISMVHLTRTPTPIRILASFTWFDGRFSTGVWLKSNDELLQRYDQSYQENIARVADQCLSQCGLARQHVHYILPHNVNIQTWKKLAKNMGFSMEQVYTKNIARYGHCFGGDMFVNLHSLCDELKSSTRVSGNKVICLAVAAGIGASFGATLIEISMEEGKE